MSELNALFGENVHPYSRALLSSVFNVRRFVKKQKRGHARCARRRFAFGNIFRSPYGNKLPTAYAQMCTRIRAGMLVFTHICWNVCANKARSASVFNVRRLVKKQREDTRGVLSLLFGGTDGSWTRVQRPLDITFSVGSQSFRFPSSEHRVTGFLGSSPLIHDRYKGEISVHVHYWFDARRES